MNWELIADNYPQLLEGAWTTIWMVTISLIIGLVLAFTTAIMSTSSNIWLKLPAETFSYLFRGTPLLIQLYIFYFGFGILLGSIDGIQDSIYWPIIKLSEFWAILAMSLNTAAYTCEILRGAIVATPHGEIEAAKSLGMTEGKMMERILLPSAFRRSLPAYGNEVIYMLHGSAVLSWVTINDLTGVAKLLRNDYYDFYTPFITIAVMYLAITICIVFIFKQLEKNYLSYLKR